MLAIKTLKLRIKDKHARVLGQMAREVNRVFNFCNETSMRAIRLRYRWLSGHDLQKLTAGYSQCEGVTVGSGTVQRAKKKARSRPFTPRSKINARMRCTNSAPNWCARAPPFLWAM